MTFELLEIKERERSNNLKRIINYQLLIIN
jgi:hypothetical protein